MTAQIIIIIIIRRRTRAICRCTFALVRRRDVIATVSPSHYVIKLIHGNPANICHFLLAKSLKSCADVHSTTALRTHDADGDYLISSERWGVKGQTTHTAATPDAFKASHVECYFSLAIDPSIKFRQWKSNSSLLQSNSLTDNRSIQAQAAWTKATSQIHKKLSYCRETAWRAMSVEILSTAAQLYEKSHLKGLQ